MEPVHFLSRRRLLQGTATATFSGLLPRHALAKTTTIGFIYVGSRDDYGYNQAHAAGRRRAEEDAAASRSSRKKRCRRPTPSKRPWSR